MRIVALFKQECLHFVGQTLLRLLLTFTRQSSAGALYSRGEPQMLPSRVKAVQLYMAAMNRLLFKVRLSNPGEFRIFV